jgi:hypothetical protein
VARTAYSVAVRARSRLLEPADAALDDVTRLVGIAVELRWLAAA